MTNHPLRIDIEHHRKQAHLAIRRLPSGVGAKALDEGCRYILDGGGKRIRAVLALLACRAVGGRAARALPAAAAVEVMHNFTLVHDDVMDHAPTRRGRPTVHTKWDVNNAILVGDVLMGDAYMSLATVPKGDYRRLFTIFTRALLDVCDGQAYDIAFENRNDVSVRQYFSMIEKKTGALIATAAELGGIIGGGTKRQTDALRRFGLSLGRAFQVQDDLLDIIADPDAFGKTTGGDVLEGKRTYLLLRAAEKTRGDDRALVERVLRKEGSGGAWRDAAGKVTPDGESVVAAMAALYERHGILDDARKLVQRNTRDALTALAVLPDSPARRALTVLADDLTTRLT
jgi:geranylgeranyl diphosphate synthase, type II